MHNNGDLESRIARLESEIETIQARNMRVELDKGWERSRVRIGAITAITYLVALLVLWSIDAPNPALSAIVPTVGYLLSVQTMPRVKQRWVERSNNRNKKRS